MKYNTTIQNQITAQPECGGRLVHVVALVLGLHALFEFAPENLALILAPYLYSYLRGSPVVQDINAGVFSEQI